MCGCRHTLGALKWQWWRKSSARQPLQQDILTPHICLHIIINGNYVKYKKIWPNNWFLFLKENALTPKVKIKFNGNLEKMVRLVSHIIQHCGYSECAERHPKNHGEINFTIGPLLLVLFVKICDNWKICFTHYRVCKI